MPKNCFNQKEKLKTKKKEDSVKHYELKQTRHRLKNTAGEWIDEKTYKIRMERTDI